MFFFPFRCGALVKAIDIFAALIPPKPLPPLISRLTTLSLSVSPSQSPLPFVERLIHRRLPMNVRTINTLMKGFAAQYTAIIADKKSHGYPAALSLFHWLIDDQSSLSTTQSPSHAAVRVDAIPALRPDTITLNTLVGAAIGDSLLDTAEQVKKLLLFVNHP